MNSLTHRELGRIFYAYSGLLYLTVVFIFSAALMSLGRDGLLVKVISFATVIVTPSIIPVLIAMRNVSAKTELQLIRSRSSVAISFFITIPFAFSYVMVGVLFRDMYVYPIINTANPMVATSVQNTGGGLFKQKYKIETNTGIFYIKYDLVATGQPFELQTRETKDGLETKEYVCVKNMCAGIEGSH